MHRTTRMLSLVALLIPPLGAVTGAVQPTAAACATITTLRVTGWGEPDPETQLLQRGIDAFNRRNPCILARYRATTQQDYQGEIAREFAGKTESDVFYASPDMIATEGRAGLLLKLDPYLAGGHVSPGDYIPDLLKVFQIDGSTYGLPKDWGTAALLYNEDIFTARHVSYPADNLTYDQYRTLAKRLTTRGPAAEAVYGTAIPEDFDLLVPLLYGFGTGIFDPNGNTILFDNARATRALAYYTGFQLLDRSIINPVGVDGGAAIDGFGAGRVAMMIEGSWRLPYLRSAYPRLRFSVAEMPIGPAGRAAPRFTNAWSASARTAHPAAAAKLIAYLTGASFQRQQLHLGFAMPTITALQADPSLRAPSALASFYAAYTAGRPVSFGRYDDAVNNALADAVVAVLSKRETPAHAIATAARALQSQIKGRS